MGRWLVRLVAGAVVALAGLATVFLVGCGRSLPPSGPRPPVQPGRDRPPCLALGWLARRLGVGDPPCRPGSGRQYETPVGPFAVGDDFVIGLPYGPGADWVRNVLANGSATLVHQGQWCRPPARSRADCGDHERPAVVRATHAPTLRCRRVPAAADGLPSIHRRLMMSLFDWPPMTPLVLPADQPTLDRDEFRVGTESRGP